MERKTKVHVEGGKHDLVITREFDLPVNLLFRAHVTPEIVSQWMGTKVIKLESKKHGSWEYETSDPKKNVVVRMGGVIHEFEPNRKITRTFEMENAPFGVQLEVLEFTQLTADTSKLTMHVIYETIEQRDQMLKLPFSYGINMAHDRLQDVVNDLK